MGESKNLSTYKDFIKKTLQDIGEEDKSKYCYKIKRWTPDVPYWCIFFCEKKDNRVIRILGHHCVTKEENVDVSDFLDDLMETFVEIKISRKFFISAAEYIY